MPAAAVIRDPKALSGFIGRKESVGVPSGFLLNIKGLTLEVQEKPMGFEGVRGWWNGRCRGEIR